MDEWAKRQADLEAAAAPLEKEMQRVFEKYGQTQSLTTAETDLPAIFTLLDDLEKHQKDIGAAKKWLNDVLPEKEHEADNMAEDYSWKADNVRGLIGDLQSDIASAKGLLSAEENIQTTLATLEPVAATTLKQSPVDPTTLRDFAAAVDTAALNVDQLETDAARRSQERVQTPHEINATDDKRRVTRLRAAVEAARALADAAEAAASADADFARVNADLAHKMDTAALADSDPAADQTSLSSAIEELNRAEADFNKLYEIYDKIEPSGSEAEQLRTKLGDELAKADEQFKTLTIALDDKLAGLDQFESAAKPLKDKIEGVGKAAAAPATTPEQLRALLSETIPAIERDLALLKDTAEVLAPIAAPAATAANAEKALGDVKKAAERRLEEAQEAQSAVDALQHDITAASDALETAVTAAAPEEPKKKSKKDKKKGKEAPVAATTAAPSTSATIVPIAELERDVARLREEIVPALERAANAANFDGAEDARARAIAEMHRAVAALASQDDLLNQWEARKLDLFTLQQPLEQEMEELFTRYTQPQRYDLATTEVPRIAAMATTMDDYKKTVDAAKQWAHDRLPAKEHEADNMLAAAGWESQQIKDLNEDLAAAIGSATAIKDAFDKLHDGIVKLESEAVAINSPEKVDELEQQLAELDKDIANRPQDRVLNPPGLDIEGARARLDNLSRLFNAKADDVENEKAIVEATSRFANGADACKSMMDVAAKIDADPSAIVEQLQKAADSISESMNDIAYMQNEHDHFNPANKAGEELKTKMADDLAKALEEARALERSIDDKIAGLGSFKDNATKAEEALQRVKESSQSADTPEKMEALLKTLEEAKAEIMNLEERAEELAPLEAPRKHSQALATQASALAKHLGDELEKIKEADAKKKEMRDSIDKAKEAVQSAVALLTGEDSDKKEKPKKKKGKKERKESESKEVPNSDELAKKIADLHEQLKPMEDVIGSPFDAPAEKMDAVDLKRAANDLIATMQKTIDNENE
ncbi:hypothetical protein PENTCL1PPCAC_20636, partial [Pristionchus entomophagus]